MKKVTFLSRNGQGIAISAILNFPPDFDETKKYPAIVVSHPGGGVKEQTAGLYAGKLAANGLIAIAFDRSYQGESTRGTAPTGKPLHQHRRRERRHRLSDDAPLCRSKQDRRDGHLRRRGI